jgi:16S rRNA (guanine527-N7)-methyltransferase
MSGSRTTTASRRPARGTSPIATSSSSFREAWLRAVVETPGLTALSLDDARAVLLEDSLRPLELVGTHDGPIVDVGSGGGVPGIPLADALPEREVVLLESERRKCDFLERWAPANARVVWGRAEEQPTDWAGVATAKALASPPVAAEWCLPLVRTGGAAILWLGEGADLERLVAVSEQLGAAAPELHDGLAVLRKVAPTPPGFPRRMGVARKRPLA